MRYAVIALLLGLPSSIASAYWQVDTSLYSCEATHHASHRSNVTYATMGAHVRLRSDAITRLVRERDFPTLDPAGLVLEFTLPGVPRSHDGTGNTGGYPGRADGGGYGYAMKARLYPGAAYEDTTVYTTHSFASYGDGYWGGSVAMSGGYDGATGHHAPNVKDCEGGGTFWRCGYAKRARAMSSELTWAGFDRHAELPKAKTLLVKWTFRQDPGYSHKDRRTHWRAFEFEFPMPSPRILAVLDRCVSRLVRE